jgi:hypothetical protein
LRTSYNVTKPEKSVRIVIQITQKAKPFSLKPAGHMGMDGMDGIDKNGP